MIQGSDIPQWTLIIGFAIKTPSETEAVRLARLLEDVPASRQEGVIENVEWCRLGLWRQRHG